MDKRFDLSVKVIHGQRSRSQMQEILQLILQAGQVEMFKSVMHLSCFNHIMSGKVDF